MLDTSLRQQLNELKLKKFVELLDDNYDLYQQRDMTFFEILTQVTDAEIQNRRYNRIQRMIKSAKFDYPSARLNELDYAPQRKLKRENIQRLASGLWLQKKQNLLIFGKTGTGKTWLSNALGICACQQNQSTFFIKAQQLQEKISNAIIVGNLSQFRQKLIKNRLLIIDDFALGLVNTQVAQLMLEIIDLQSRNGSLLVTSQFSIEHWHAKFEDSTLADAIFDRIIDNAHIIEIEGDSRRKLAEKFE